MSVYTRVSCMSDSDLKIDEIIKGLRLLQGRVLNKAEQKILKSVSTSVKELTKKTIQKWTDAEEKKAVKKFATRLSAYKKNSPLKLHYRAQDKTRLVNVVRDGVQYECPGKGCKQVLCGNFNPVMRALSDWTQDHQFGQESVHKSIDACLQQVVTNNMVMFSDTTCIEFKCPEEEGVKFLVGYIKGCFEECTTKPKTKTHKNARVYKGQPISDLNELETQLSDPELLGPQITRMLFKTIDFERYANDLYGDNLVLTCAHCNGARSKDSETLPGRYLKAPTIKRQIPQSKQ